MAKLFVVVGGDVSVQTLSVFVGCGTSGFGAGEFPIRSVEAGVYLPIGSSYRYVVASFNGAGMFGVCPCV